MNYNTDGFNERNVYIHNSLDRNRINNSKPVHYDNSLTKMIMDDNKPDIHTAEQEYDSSNAEIKQTEIDNKLLRDINLNNMIRNNRMSRFK